LPTEESVKKLEGGGKKRIGGRKQN